MNKKYAELKKEIDYVGTEYHTVVVDDAFLNDIINKYDVHGVSKNDIIDYINANTEIDSDNRIVKFTINGIEFKKSIRDFLSYVMDERVSCYDTHQDEDDIEYGDSDFSIETDIFDEEEEEEEKEEEKETDKEAEKETDKEAEAKTEAKTEVKTEAKTEVKTEAKAKAEADALLRLILLSMLG